MEQIAHGLCTNERIKWSKIRPEIAEDKTTFVIGKFTFCFERRVETHEPTHCEPAEDIRYYTLEVAFEEDVSPLYKYSLITEFLLYRHTNGQCALYTRYTSPSVQGMANIQFATTIKSCIFSTNGEVIETGVCCECKTKLATENGCRLCIDPNKLHRRTGLSL
jgi:hypothetical protein